MDILLDNLNGLDYVTPILIFFARLLDMTLDTVRVIYVTRGEKYTAAILGFFQTLIWVFAISQVIANLGGLLNAFAYAAGFSAGTFVGIFVEGKLALGKVMLRLVTRKNSDDLLSVLEEAGYGYTVSKGHGHRGEVSIIYIVVVKKLLKKCMDLIRQNHPRAFISVSDVKEAQEDIMPPYKKYSTGFSWMQMWKR
ncbi:MAG TPA: DUF5698 domain-containing protein [Oligoflexia bacterium]|nr:DUF5698 domain-containing protein [Oligoflexia bacterium]HMR25238.1 DUF5698 domain-containing protein [Oligoflexia bacterium]